jgi:hypothetical protein
MEKSKSLRNNRVSASEVTIHGKEKRGRRGCPNEEIDARAGMREILSQETIYTQNRRQIILNGLIYDDSDSEQRRDENIKKLDDLLQIKQRSPGKHRLVSSLPHRASLLLSHLVRSMDISRGNLCHQKALSPRQLHPTLLHPNQPLAPPPSLPSGMTMTS